MSAIASFYLVPDSRLEELAVAAMPVKRFLRRTEDRFYDVLDVVGRELPDFDVGSGWIFNTLDLYLQEAHQLGYGSYAEPRLSGQMETARGSCWLAYPAEHAARLLVALDGVQLSDAGLAAFIARDYPEDDPAEGAAVNQLAMTKLKDWLRDVPAGSTGLLSVG